MDTYNKLDGVGPVDNRPFTDKLHHFVRKKKDLKKNYMWHITCDTHMTCDMWHVVGGSDQLLIILWFFNRGPAKY